MEIMMIDTKAIEEHIRGILVALGDDPEREGLKDTPKRVAKMYEEVFLGMNYSNHEIAQMFDKTFEDGIEELDTSKVVVMKDIDLFSYCEHHMAGTKIFAGNLPFVSSFDTGLSHPGGILGNSRTGASGRGRFAQLSYNINKEQNQAPFRKK